MRTMVFTVVTVLLVAAAIAKQQSPPVIWNLGPVEPTPPPAAEAADRIRLITSFTLRNKPDGESLISFETTDLSMSTEEKKETVYRVISSANYSLAEPKKALKPLRNEIVRKVRELESDLLRYAERAAPARDQ